MPALTNAKLSVNPRHPVSPPALASAIALVALTGLLACGCGQKAPSESTTASAPAPDTRNPAADSIEPGPGATGATAPTADPMSRVDIARALAAKGQVQPAAPPLPTAWHGQVSLPSDQKLGISVRFTPAATADLPASATLSILAQGLVDAALSNVIFTPQRIAFDLPLPAPPGAVVHVEATPTAPAAGGAPGTPWEATGTLTQSGATFPINLSSAIATPKTQPPTYAAAAEPVPYTTREVTILAGPAVSTLQLLAAQQRALLAPHGSLDTQVNPTSNLAGFRTAIPAERLTIVEFPGVNHLFQTAKTGQPDEYAKLPPTFAPGVVEAITAWLLNR